jgi:MFS transporter, DHA3 family, macrolide efflux protein
MTKKTLWTRDFTTLTVATAFGAIGNIAGGFALSFLVYNETQSTLASAITLAIKVIPGFIIPLVISPIMDRIPRKLVLVGCDAVSALVYVAAGLWLKAHDFAYIEYLLFSLVISSIGIFDELSYNSIYPKVIPHGMEEKGYSVSSMLYPVLMMVMTPLSAFLYKTIGVANILIAQGFLCLLAAVTENQIKIKEEIREGTDFSIRQWLGDLKETAEYYKKEKGLRALTLYCSTTNAFAMGYESIMIAFFSTMPGFTIAMYSFFTVVEFIGRSVGGVLMYRRDIPKEKKYGFALTVYLFYDSLDAILLWLSYPLMLVNRLVCGFLGIQSATMRYAATQKYIPDSMRARVSAFQSVIYLIFNAAGSLIIGTLGEIIPLKFVPTVGGTVSIIACLLTVVLNKSAVEKIYAYDPAEGEAAQEQPTAEPSVQN